MTHLLHDQSYSLSDDNRLWVRQEAALAKQLVFHHEGHQIEWQTVERFFDTFIMAQGASQLGNIFKKYGKG